MEAENPEVAAWWRRWRGLHAAISKLPSLDPSPAVDALFTELVAACVPPSPVDVTRLGPAARWVREELSRLCSDAEGRLEAHYADALAAFDNPLHHLHRFPYYGNYVSLSRLEHELLARYAAGGMAPAPARVAFVGSGPLPFSSLVLAVRHMPEAVFDNYDLDGAANERARRLVRAGAANAGGVRARMSFRTADISDLRDELSTYDVVFLAALVGVAAEEKARIIAHLGRYMADGAALVVRSVHGARGFLYPIVDPADVARGGFDVLAVYHPDDEVINSVIVARKAAAPKAALGTGGAMPVVSPPCSCCDCATGEEDGQGRRRRRGGVLLTRRSLRLCNSCAYLAYSVRVRYVTLKWRITRSVLLPIINWDFPT